MKIQGVQLVRRKAKDGIGVARIENYYLCTATYAVPSADNEGWTLVEEGKTIPTPTASAPYLWHKTITVMTDGTTLAPVIEFCGSLGQNGFDYDLVPSATIILKDSDGNVSPTTISCSLIRREADGSATKMKSVPTGYSVKFKYEQYPEMDYPLGEEGPTSAISTVVSFLLYYGEVLVERHDIRVVSEGAQGVDGRGIQSLDYRFKATEKNTAPAAPTSDAEWSDQWFSLDSAGYSAEKPYLYRCVKTVYVDGLKNTTTEYAVDGPTVWGKKGDTGNGIKSEVKVYSVTADTATEPTSWLENWFNLLVILNPNYPYVWECTKTTYTNGDVAYVGKHIIGMNTDYVEKGTQYALGDNGTTEPTSGWASTYTATEGKWLWERTEYKWQRVTHTYTAGTCKGYFPEKGKNGEAGMVMRVTEWQEGTEYHNDEGKDLSPRYLDIVTVTNADGTFEAYQCKQTHTSDSAVNPPDNDDYWTKMNSMRPIYTPLIVAQNAVMRLAQSNQVVIVNSNNKVQGCFGGVDDETNGYPLWMGGETAKDAKFKVKYDGTLEATGGTFSGTMKSVSGSFKSLNCVDSNDNIVGNIAFGSDGKMWFDGDMYSQGYNSKLSRSNRFYTSDVWCRGMFGHYEKTMAVVKGAYMYVYPKGISQSGVRVNLKTGTTTNNKTFYYIPLYGSNGDLAGMPIDVVVFNTTSDFYYAFTNMGNGKEWRVINGNNNQTVHFCDIGGWHELGGGHSVNCMYVNPEWVNPVPSTADIARGVFWTGETDLNW